MYDIKDECNMNDICKTVWRAADELRANSGLMPGEYCLRFLDLLFFKLADPLVYADALSHAEKVGAAVDDALKALEKRMPELSGVLPVDYAKMDPILLRNIAGILESLPSQAGGDDAIGRLYEYFVDRFSLLQSKEDGTFYTPDAIVRLMAEVLSPENGTVFDPACGTGGMFASLSSQKLKCFGQDKNENTVRIASMNAVLHGSCAMFVKGNTYYEDPLNLCGRCDTIMSNPPFNVSGVNAERAKEAGRLPFGLPELDREGKIRNANYLWAQYFYSYLNEHGRGAFIMPCSALQSRGRDAEIRRKIIETGCIESIVTIGEGFFHNSTVPCSLWFIDKSRLPGSPTLFIDASSLYREAGRTLRTWDCAQASLIASAMVLSRGDAVHYNNISANLRGKILKLFKDVSVKCNRMYLYFKYADAENWEKIVADIAHISSGEVELCLLKVKLRLIIEETSRQSTALPEHLCRLPEAEKRAAFTDMYDAAGHRRLNNRQVLHAAFREAESLIESAEYCADIIDTTLRMEECFSGGSYRNVPELCRMVELCDIEAAGWSLNSAIYIDRSDVASVADVLGNADTLREAAAELSRLNAEYADIMGSLEFKLRELMS